MPPNTANNPFYIQPAVADISPVLQGLGVVAERNRAEKKRLARSEEINAAMQSGDPSKIAAASIKFPEMSKAISDSFGITNKQTERIARDTYSRVLSDPANALDYMTKGIERVTAAGGTPDAMVQDTQMLQQNPEGGLRRINAAFAAFDGKTWQDIQAGKVKVGAQQILEDGTIIQSTNKGPVVYAPTGEKLTGKNAAQAVKTAQAEKVSNLRKAAGQKRLATLEAEEELKAKVEAGVVSAKAAATASVDAYKKLAPLNLGIANIDKAIALIDKGAKTSFIRAKLPSIKSLSIRLDNLQKQMGLDVIGSTTFGALSQGELDLALSTALPLTLEGPELKQWLLDKKAAQQKLSDYIESSAIFLGTPGNTIKDWLELKANEQVEKTATSPPPVDKNAQAMEWAKANPNDPRAAQILQKLGVRNGL